MPLEDFKEGLDMIWLNFIKITLAAMWMVKGTRLETSLWAVGMRDDGDLGASGRR